MAKQAKLTEKYKWAIDLIKSLCGEQAQMLLKEFDYGHGLSIAIEQDGRMAGLFLQRARFENYREHRKCVGLYQLQDTQKVRQYITGWVKAFLNGKAS